MMSKTHLTIGIATALAAVSVSTPADCLAVLAGGAVGGVVADVDTIKNDYKADALIGELIAAGIVAVTFLVDYFFLKDITGYISDSIWAAIGGIIGFVVIWVIGFGTDHRTFTHSIVALALFSVCTGLVYPKLGMACFWGYVSHLVLDLLNKKGIQLFYPLKPRPCFRACYADQTANKVFMYVGLGATVLLLIFRVVLMVAQK